MRRWLLPCIFLDVVGSTAGPVAEPPATGIPRLAPFNLEVSAITSNADKTSSVRTHETKTQIGQGITSTPWRRYESLDPIWTKYPGGDDARGENITNKYFREATFHPHYDARFGKMPLTEDARRNALSLLLQTYIYTMALLDAETWLMHGSLLGWWWNRQILPWDTDLDVQTDTHSMEELATNHNMSIYTFNIHDRATNLSDGIPSTDVADIAPPQSPPMQRDYLLDVNPNYRNSSVLDSHNMIDARWIDMSTGLFIDITTLRPNETAADLGLEGRMMCKDRHRYLSEDIFPLRTSTFEGVDVQIPFAYPELLVAEYGKKSLALTFFAGHTFKGGVFEWRKFGLFGDQQTSVRKQLEPIFVGSRRVEEWEEF